MDLTPQASEAPESREPHTLAVWALVLHRSHMPSDTCTVHVVISEFDVSPKNRATEAIATFYELYRRGQLDEYFYDCDEEEWVVDGASRIADEVYQLEPALP